jgi:hypothetical protein
MRRAHLVVVMKRNLPVPPDEFENSLTIGGWRVYIRDIDRARLGIGAFSKERDHHCHAEILFPFTSSI